MSVVEAVEAEYRAAHEGCAVFDASAREQLRVTGSEAGSFLQGMVTNDVEGLAVGGSCYAAMLTPKGAMVGDLRVLRREGDYLLDTGPGRGAAVKDFLNKYLISEDAELHDAPEYAVLGLVGPRAKELAAKVPAEGALGSFLGGVDLLVRRERLGEAKAALAGVPELSAATLEVLRVEAGVPVFGVDMTETTIPLEANLDNAIHYKKGCYIGQEVIARATFRGQMNKKLVKLLVGEASPAPKAELKVGDRKVGWVTSVVKSVQHGQQLALAYVHRDFLSPGTKLELGGATATLL
ncbi:MAG: YgfZ/GcvT domain-containing protein [Myxococcota bacterium]